MDYIKKTYDFLKSKNFELTQKEMSEFFGDYYDIFSNTSLQLRFSSSRSYQTIDIRCNKPGENWFDLALVKALLYNEKILDKVTVIEEYCNFLQKEIYHILKLFEHEKYPIVKKRLEELEIERVKQMFS